MADNELKLSDVALKLICISDRINLSEVSLIFILKEKESFLTRDAKLVLMTTPKRENRSELLLSNLSLFVIRSKLRHTVRRNFRTCRTIRDVDYNKHLKFDGETSCGKLQNALAGQKNFTVVLKVATNESGKKDSYLYQFPWMFGCKEYSSSGGAFGIGVDNSNAYVWSNMGDGGELS